MSEREIELVLKVYGEQGLAILLLLVAAKAEQALIAIKRIS